ncbi:hypothetical protein CLV24_12450 [Pontibacter ummariensis]|uniref:Uncharacterized protein n=1 Tax=Pontibacter ummariensis TaxID=1610492 RepID=A0A239JVT9_9BACT|nr:hypothetical protein [Pontibacter ummariensis]PRY07312.1 hypothetical protein CLV24_12450 [Pontibacter ummariensis]SNT09880.1 hypothetical protein SAMN06296052_12414 [Pontibacter ummariensis]
MEELSRLIHLVVERGSKSSMFVNQQDEESLETKLFNLVKQNQVTTDQDAASLLYGKNTLPASYRMLKSRLRKKLFNQLHFLKFPTGKYRGSVIHRYECDGLLLEAQSLMLGGELKMAGKVIDQALNIAKSSELNSIIVRALELKQSVSLMAADQKAYGTADVELQKYYEIESRERKATKLFGRASMELNQGVLVRSQFLSKVPMVLKELYALWQETNSSLIFEAYHILSIHFLELTGDYEAIHQTIERAELLLNEGKVSPAWFNHRYNSFIKVYALLQTRQFEQGIEQAEQYIKHFTAYSLNWYAFQENYLLLALHSQKLELATELIGSCLSNLGVNKLQSSAKERWELYRRYLLLSVKHQRLKSTDQISNIFLTELTALPKDKEGFNLSLLVLDAIELLSNPNLDDYEPLAERIRKYISKYLRGEKAERGRLFLRMLLLVIKEGLDPAQSREKGERLLEKLSVALPPGDAFAEVEIVPYEHLWELVLNLLERRR